MPVGGRAGEHGDRRVAEKVARAKAKEDVREGLGEGKAQRKLIERVVRKVRFFVGWVQELGTEEVFGSLRRNVQVWRDEQREVVRGNQVTGHVSLP